MKLSSLFLIFGQAKNPDSRFSLIWFCPSSLPSQDIESPTGNLHFPQINTTGPSSLSSSSSTWPNNFSSTAVESMLDVSNVVFTLMVFIFICRCFVDFCLDAIFTKFLQKQVVSKFGGWMTVKRRSLKYPGPERFSLLCTSAFVLFTYLNECL